MAETGIKITTTDTVLGAPIDVNTTSMIIYMGSVGDGNVYKIKSSGDSVVSKLSDEVRTAVKKYYNPANGISLEGKLLWCASWSPLDEDVDDIVAIVKKTAANSFDERPRQILFLGSASQDVAMDITTPPTVQEALNRLSEEGIRAVSIVTLCDSNDSSALNSPFVAVCPMLDSEEVDSNDSEPLSFTGQARALGMLASVSVGTSIGDGGLPALTEPSIIALGNGGDGWVEVANVRSLRTSRLNELGESQKLFTRPRPPRNGLWWNDGATCNDPANALSTLEMARTICAMADDLQSFFVPYINTRVPVTSTGDIQSAYKQVVLDNARAAVVQKYIDNGDISDARISLVAKDNDMIGTRTWEVTLSILPAPTLRWIDGYVFYVNSLE